MQQYWWLSRLGLQLHWIRTRLIEIIQFMAQMLMKYERMLNTTHFLVLFRRLGSEFHLIRVKVATTCLVRRTSQVSKGLLWVVKCFKRLLLRWWGRRALPWLLLQLITSRCWLWIIKFSLSSLSWSLSRAEVLKVHIRMYVGIQNQLHTIGCLANELHTSVHWPAHRHYLQITSCLIQGQYSH